MALEDLSARGSAAAALRLDASAAEMMRDQALQEHLERGERLRREALRQAAEAEAAREAQRQPAHEAADGDTDARRALEAVGGLGAARIDALLDAFPSVGALRAAGPEELVAVQGIGPALARKITDSLHASGRRGTRR